MRRTADDAWWAEAVPLMVNEDVPNTPVRAYGELYNRQLANGGIPKGTAPQR